MRRIVKLTLLIIAIIVVVGVVASLKPNKAEVIQRDTQRVVDVQQLRVALSVYHGDHSVYPVTLDELVPEYIETVPHDPLQGESHRDDVCQKELNGSSYAYTYQQMGAGASFTLAACLEQAEDSRVLSVDPFI